MKKIILIVLIMLMGGLGLACGEKAAMETEAKTISVDGFQATWTLQGEDLVVEMSAPTQGWVALGFNPQNDIVNTNLIMGAVSDEALVLEDQYVVRMGEHPPVTEIGGQSAIFAISGTETKEGTTISFRIPQQAIDPYHYGLTPQKEIYLICAYSQADDFDHHSIMRKHLKVTL